MTTTPTATSSGFVYGAAAVEARPSYSEGRGRGDSTSLSIATAYDEIHVYVSPTGRSIRVFRGNREMYA